MREIFTIPSRFFATAGVSLIRVCGLAILACVFSSTSQAELVGSWTFDNSDLDESSGFAADGTHDGLAFGTVGFSTDVPTALGSGMSLDLTGAGSYVSVLNSDADAGGPLTTAYANTFDGQLQDGMTVAFWAQGTVGRWSPFISKFGESDANNGFGGFQVRQQNRGPSPTFTLRGTNQVNADPFNGTDTFDDITPEWQHFAATWDAANGERKLYVDGQLAFTEVDATTDPDGFTVADNFALVFGARDNGAGGISSIFNGRLDDIFIFDNAVTAQEVAVLSGTAVTVPEPTSLALIGFGAIGMLVRRKRS